MKQKRFIEILIACALTFLAARILIQVIAGDLVYSVVPGWHTIIYPPEMTLTVLTAILLCLTLIVIGIFKGVLMLTCLILDLIHKGSNKT